MYTSRKRENYASLASEQVSRGYVLPGERVLTTNGFIADAALKYHVRDGSTVSKGGSIRHYHWKLLQNRMNSEQSFWKSPIAACSSLNNWTSHVEEVALFTHNMITLYRDHGNVYRDLGNDEQTQFGIYFDWKQDQHKNNRKMGKPKALRNRDVAPAISKDQVMFCCCQYVFI